MLHIMVVEDEKNARRMLATVLQHAGYSVYQAENGLDALDLIEKQHIDLIVLDIMMPNMDGYEFTRVLRENGNLTPILMVTAKQQPNDKKTGFLVGADDYMTKPVDTEEMLLRIKAILKRSQMVHDHTLTVGEVLLDYGALTVTRGEEQQTLPQKEFYLLYKLLSFPERIFTRMQLMDEIWGIQSETTDSTINVHIARLRRRFKEYPEFEIVAIRGLGYKAVKKI